MGVDWIHPAVLGPVAGSCKLCYESRDSVEEDALVTEHVESRVCSRWWTSIKNLSWTCDCTW